MKTTTTIAVLLLAAFTVLAQTSPPREDPKSTRELAETTWTWGTSIASATSTLRFMSDGTYSVNNEVMGKWTPLNSTSVRFENGSILKFSKDMKTYKGKTPSGDREGKRRQP